MYGPHMPPTPECGLSETMLSKSFARSRSLEAPHHADVAFAGLRFTKIVFLTEAHLS